MNNSIKMVVKCWVIEHKIKYTNHVTTTSTTLYKEPSSELITDFAVRNCEIGDVVEVRTFYKIMSRENYDFLVTNKLI